MSGLVGRPPGTTTLTLPDGQTVALGDWIDDRHWSTVELENGDGTTLIAFSSGRSQQIVGGQRMNTLVDTNIPGSGTTGLPPSWMFLVYGLAIEFTRAARLTPPSTVLQLADFSDPLRFATFYQLNRRVSLEYSYNGKDYSQGLVEDYPQGHGAYIFTTQPATENVTNGVPSPRDRLAMVIPIWERDGLGYGMSITPVIPLVIAQPASDAGAALSFVDMRVTKNGLIRRTVR
jgi:hypothetical protein